MIVDKFASRRRADDDSHWRAHTLKGERVAANMELLLIVLFGSLSSLGGKADKPIALQEGLLLTEESWPRNPLFCREGEMTKNCAVVDLNHVKSFIFVCKILRFEKKRATAHVPGRNLWKKATNNLRA
jgi:hypothetical protein